MRVLFDVFTLDEGETTSGRPLNHSRKVEVCRISSTWGELKATKKLYSIRSRAFED